MEKSEIDKLIKNKEFNKLFEKFMERAKYLSEKYQKNKEDNEEALKISDCWAICARDILINEKALPINQDLINRKNKEAIEVEKLHKYIFEKAQNLANIFSEYDEITELSFDGFWSRHTSEFKLNPPEYQRSDDYYINIKNLLTIESWFALLREIIINYTDSVFNYFLDNFQKCVEDYIFYNLDFYDGVEFNSEQSENGTFSFLHDRRVKTGCYYRYIQLVEKLKLEINKLEELKDICCLCNEYYKNYKKQGSLGGINSSLRDNIYFLIEKDKF